MRNESLAFLKNLIETPSPCGHEARGQRVWMDYAGQFADETFSDAYGNCVAVLNKGGSPRVMLAGHADEIAMTVNFINADGFIYVRKVGGIDPIVTRAQRVVIHTAGGPVKGVVGNVAPHLTKTEGEPKAPKIHDLFIDIGAGSAAEAKKLVRVGDLITIEQGFDVLRGDLAVARAFDNRIGTFAVAETLRLLGESKTKVHAEICAVSNIMEEVGLFGARQIAYSLQPDLALVVDVTHATDYPTVSKEQHGDVKIGAGPAITHGGCNHREIVTRLEVVAAKQNPTATRGNVRHERHGRGRDFLDTWRNPLGIDQPAEPLHALAGRVGEPERFEENPRADGGVLPVAQEWREVQN